MNFAAVEGLLFLVMVGLGVQFKAVNWSGINNGNVGELDRDKGKHYQQCRSNMSLGF